MKDLEKQWGRAFLLWIGLAIAIGILCRFITIDQKLYWHDETFTSLRISGFTEQEMVVDLRDRQQFPIGYVQKYQIASAERGLGGTLMGLAKEEPQITPLYYGVARLWADIFGSSVTAMRVFPALLSLLALPAMYWLCLELFQSRVTAVIGAALVASSPFHVLYAQESRSYSLWTVWILITSATLLRALRVKTARAWALYGLSLTAGLYTQLLTLLVAIAHAVYVLLRQKGKISKSLLHYSVAFTGAIAVLLPWFAIVLANRSQVNKVLMVGKQSWTPSPLNLIVGMVRQPSKLFFDINLHDQVPFFTQLLQRSMAIALLLLMGYAIWVLWRTAKPATWQFVLALVLSSSVGLFLQDVVLKGQGGGASLFPRYHFPMYLGLQLAVAYLLGYGLSHVHHFYRTQLWRVVLVLVLSLSLGCSIYTTQSKTWWIKGSKHLEALYPAAAIINRSPNPVLVTDSPSWDLTQISYLIDPKTPVVAMPACFACRLPPAQDFNPDIAALLNRYSDVFVFPAASQELRDRIQKSYSLEVVEVDSQPNLDSALYRVGGKQTEMEDKGIES
ncbi:MAG TPA: glycosyltransferase family 39 protein [Leptolyngbyaceae cyanobacterium M33_DOE_097]|uniref:Glycosyltransferase RgtA/B/C/D-like domain-containing protein n=1 Tax=Oscillatoriales cyanobacterium SpSt-418 TaxID=2282169 RepID=A0A7C3KKJ4_9CYAN|nr:glycosyltransferase family 39 protein [Leptolyngbyaceae cyanobacterium M33_DOE_097]